MGFKTAEEVKGAREEMRERREAIISAMDTSVGIVMNHGDCTLGDCNGGKKVQRAHRYRPKGLRPWSASALYGSQARQQGLALRQDPIPPRRCAARSSA